MIIYLAILIEFILISTSIILMFKYRTKLGLAPLYILLGSVQYLHALSGSMISFTLFGEYPIYPSSVIIFSAVLFALLLIYIKEGVASARTLIIGVIISNVILSALFGVTYVQENATHIISIEDSSSVFQINYKYFITGTGILLIDFILLVIIYQFLISKLSKLYFFLVLFISLFSVLVFDAFAFNLILKYEAPNLTSSLIGHIIGKSFTAVIFSLLLYIYLKFIDKDEEYVSFIASQDRDIFSIITYRKKYLDLKVEKREVEKKFLSQIESTLNQISDGFVSLDSDWCYTYVNDKAGEFLGRSPESLIGKHIWTEFPDDFGLPFCKAHYKAVETQQTQYFINYYQPFDKWFENRIYPSPDGLSIYFTDFTERKKAEIALKESEKYLDNIIDNIGDPVFVKDSESRLLLVNDAFCKIFNSSKEDVIGKTLAENVSPEERENFLRIDKQVISTGVENVNEETLTLGGEATRIVSTKKTRFVDGNGTKFLIGVIRDITDRKNAEIALTKKEKKYRSLIEQASDGVIITDLETNILEVNKNLAKLFGYLTSELVGMKINELVADRELTKLPKRLKQLNAGLNPVYERVMKRKDGTEFIAEVNSNKIDSGLLVAFIRDITERKKAEEIIKESEERFAAIFKAAPGAIILTSLTDMKTVEVNDNFSIITGYSREEAIGETIKDLNMWADPSARVSFLESIEKNGFVNDYEADVYHKSGNILNGLVSAQIITISEKKYLLGVFYDITERKKTEEEIRLAHQRLTTHLNNSPLAIIEWDKNLIIRNWSVQAKSIFGWEASEVIGKHFNELNLVHEDAAAATTIIAKDLMLGRVKNNRIIYRNYTKSKKVIYCEWYNSVLQSTEGEIETIFSLVQDISDRKHAEIELEKHRNNLEELVELRTNQLEKEKIKAQSADLMKSAFLATMSHELRTPMNSIIGFTGILLKELAGPLNDEQKRQLGMVKNSGQHLLGLINDVLDISKIEAGKLKVSIYHFNYLTTLEKTIDFILPQASRKELQILSEISELNIILNSDERRVEQVLLNLLSNAIKFSNQGVIIVKVDIVDGLVVTQVIDQGIGMSKKDLNKLFMPFIQLDGGLSRTHEGTGLGLAICKSLIEKLGGTIQVQSKVSKGSNFTFTLPLDFSNKI